MDLEEAIAQIGQRIAKHSRGAEIGEQNTKATLIEPMLRALGWDPEDIDEVRREFKAQKQDKPVDYALLSGGKPVLFVEAKGLGTNLDDRGCANQIMTYATIAGVAWVVLTDGNRYDVYNAHAAVPVQEKLLFSVAVCGAAQGVAGWLGLLAKDRVTSGGLSVAWEAHFVGRQLAAQLEALLRPQPDEALVRLIRKRLPGLTRVQIVSGLRQVNLSISSAEAEPPRAELRQAPPAAKRKTVPAAEYRRVVLECLASQPGRAASSDRIYAAVCAQLPPVGPDLDPDAKGVPKWRGRGTAALSTLHRQGRIRRRDDGLWQLAE